MTANMAVEEIVKDFTLTYTIGLVTRFLNKVRRRKQLKSKQKRCAQLVSEARRELLAIKPNLHVVKARLAQAQSMCSAPSEELSQAQEMLQRVTSTAMRRVAKTIMTTRRPKVRKKIRRKKAAKKPPKTKASRGFGRTKK